MKASTISAPSGKNEGEGMMWIWAKDVENLSFSGHGTIHGNGIRFMGAELFDSYELKPVTTFDPRPHVLTLMGVRNLNIRDITIREACLLDGASHRLRWSCD